MTRIFVAAGVLFASLGMVTNAAPASASAKEQIVFSGEGDGSFEVEFWVWCAVDEAGGYDDCNGALRFDDLGLVKHVDGDVAETGDDVYRMNVASRDGSVACSLTNGTPITSGRSNTVWIDCSTPAGTAMAEDAVVVATGQSAPTQWRCERTRPYWRVRRLTDVADRPQQPEPRDLVDAGDGEQLTQRLGIDAADE